MFTQDKAEIIYKNLREVDVEMSSRENALSEEGTNGGLPRGTRP